MLRVFASQTATAFCILTFILKLFLGSRFALMESKAILYYLLLNFSFEPNKDTQIPLKMKKGFVFATEKGVHLELRLRKI